MLSSSHLGGFNLYIVHKSISNIIIMLLWVCSVLDHNMIKHVKRWQQQEKLTWGTATIFVTIYVSDDKVNLSPFGKIEL